LLALPITILTFQLCPLNGNLALDIDKQAARFVVRDHNGQQLENDLKKKLPRSYFAGGLARVSPSRTV
jgi:hypothetical protein